MNASHVGLGDESFLLVDAHNYSDKMQSLLEETVASFCSIARRYIFFHFAMALLLLSEAAFLISSFFWLAQAALLSLSLAGLFLSCLAYFVLRLYLNGRQPELFLQLKESYIDKCRKLISHPPGSPKNYVAMASSCWKLTKMLYGQEYRFYSPPLFFRWSYLRELSEKISCWCHWEDLYRFKELLLIQAVKEHVELVKCAPTSLEVHAALANAYVILSELYLKGCQSEEEGCSPAYRCHEELATKFRATAERAVEELKILEEYAPQNSWVHAQLAYSYRDLQMREQEIKEYEAMLRLNHQDKTVLAKLGVLYFAEGRKAEGLRIYETLRELDEEQAEQLIKHYGNSL